MNQSFKMHAEFNSSAPYKNFKCFSTSYIKKKFPYITEYFERIFPY